MKDKIPLGRKQSAPRNVAAKSLREGQFRPKVEDRPDVYKRRPKHPPRPMPDPDGENT